ncbi:hypothetical protein DFH09DRAFT_1287579 [Mycena vulgaris]|nr:hypothetical protein DFH09DRAFT_1287579 [Mycena vulgaris]
MNLPGSTTPPSFFFVQEPTKPPKQRSVAPGEILALIFEEIAHPGHPAAGYGGSSGMQQLSATRKSLLAAALTCTDFCAPALDILWRTIDNMSPLLKLLTALKPTNGAYILSGIIPASDWARFHCYAQRVHRVAYRDGIPPIAMHPSVYPALAILHPTPLLPNLTSIEYSGSLNSPSPETLLLVSPTILHVEISALDLSSATIFFSTLAGVATQLSSLTIRNQPYGALEDTLSSFPQLRELNMRDMTGMIPTSFLTSLANLEHLVSLGIEINPPDYLSMLGVLWFGRFKSFPGLKHLKISCSSLPLLADFFQLFTPGVLETLFIDGRSTSEIALVVTRSPWEEIAARWRSSLRHLEIINVMTIAPPPTCEPLLTLRSLQVFSLRNCPSLSFGGSDVIGIARAWPEVRSLSIPSVTGISIQTLPIFAQKCTHLTDLDISLATSVVPPFTTTPVCAHALQHLNVRDSACPAGGVQLVARHLDRLFPRLRSVRSEGPDKARWDELEGLLLIFQDLRLHALAQS